METFTENMLHCFNTTTSLAIRVIPHLGFECFVVSPYCSVENLEGSFPCFRRERWEAWKLVSIVEGGHCWMNVYIVPSSGSVGRCNSYFCIQNVSAENLVPATHVNVHVNKGGENRSWPSIFIPVGHPLKCLGK